MLTRSNGIENIKINGTTVISFVLADNVKYVIHILTSQNKKYNFTKYFHNYFRRKRKCNIFILTSQEKRISKSSILCMLTILLYYKNRNSRNNDLI